MLSQSPYAPPRARLELEAELEGRTPGTGTFEIGRCLSDAWTATWANFPLWLGVGIAGTLATAAAAITIIGYFVLVPVLAWGFFAFFLAMHDGRARFGDLFSGFSRYGRALGGVLAWVLVTILISLPTTGLLQLAAVQGDVWTYAGAFAVHILVTTIVGMRIAFAPLLMVDREYGGFRSVRESWQLTQRIQWKMLGLMALSAVVWVAGLLALVVGILPAAVLSYLMTVSAYRQVVGGPNAASSI